MPDLVTYHIETLQILKVLHSQVDHINILDSTLHKVRSHSPLITALYCSFCSIYDVSSSQYVGLFGKCRKATATKIG